MFEKQVYVERRKSLREKVGSGLILLPGNSPSPFNYSSNTYSFRQDSTFLYFFGIDTPDLVGVIDIDEGKDFLFGADPTMEDTVWMGPQPTIAERAREIGVAYSGTMAQLEEKVSAATKNRTVHFLPTYRSENLVRLTSLLGLPLQATQNSFSKHLIRSVISLRSIKSSLEIDEIEKGLLVTHEAYAAIFATAKPGIHEREVVGQIDKVLGSHGRQYAYPLILSVHGEILHNHHHDQVMKKHDLLLVDCGAESLSHYASDITRTFPIGGKYTPEQRDVYQLVLKAQLDSIQSVRPGKSYREVHMQAATIIASGLKDMGLMRGDVASAVEQGAHALFFPHGLGHMLGLDVHDMEGLGEDFVGYDETVQRSQQFGTAYLRLAKKLQVGNVLTVEPGIYFIPALIDKWKAEKLASEFINFDKLNPFRNAGGIRIEDDVLVTEQGSRVLGKPIPKTVEEMESLMAS